MSQLPTNPPPGPKWKAKQGLCRMNLSGSEHDVIACLIECANSKTGLCYPSQDYLAAWANHPPGTVKWAVASLLKRKLMASFESRGLPATDIT